MEKADVHLPVEPLPQGKRLPRPGNTPGYHWFLGTVSPQGYFSRFDQLADPEDGWRCLVLKGGPGCGKSTLLKKLAQAFSARWDDLEYIHCASDVDSLDALLFPSIRVAVVDGTPPHSVEPRYPGAFESLVDMTAGWNEDQLYQDRAAIHRLFDQGERLREQCSHCLLAASTLLGDNRRLAGECTDQEKALAFVDRFAARELKQRPGSGREEVRLLSAVTDQGTVLFQETAAHLAGRIWRLEDEWGYSSRLLLAAVREQALRRGYRVICCPCPLFPEDGLEHLFLPELGLGLVTANRFHPVDLPPDRVINARRFTDLAKLRRSKQRLSFNRRTAAQMLQQAVELQAEGKKLHSQLEEHYRSAIDYDQTTAVTARVIDRINAMDS